MIAEVEQSKANRSGHPDTEVSSGQRPLRVFNVFKPGRFYYNDHTGMAEIIARESKFNPGTGILEVTDRSRQVDATLRGIFGRVLLGMSSRGSSY